MQPQTLIRRLIWNYPLLFPNRVAALAEILLDSDHNYLWRHGTVVLSPEQRLGLSHLGRRGAGTSLADFKDTNPGLARALGDQEILRLYQKDFETARAVRHTIETRSRDMAFATEAYAYARTRLTDQSLLDRSPVHLDPAWQAAIDELKKSLKI